ncbi:MAG TPA: hypothetical protein VF765_27655 [Polyangiaceae bacterium]
MLRRDEIDPKLAKHFAWSYVPPDQTAALDDAQRAALDAQGAQSTVELPADSEPPAALDAEESDAPEDPKDAEIEEIRERARRLVEPVADMIAEAWDSPAEDDEERFQTTRRLLVRVGRMGFDVMGFDRRPVEITRLLRMVVRIWDRLTPRIRETAERVAGIAPLVDPEAADLLVEIARAGLVGLAATIFETEEGWVPEVGDEEALMARLADVIDDGPTYVARCVAAEIIARFEWRDPAVPALRRALRMPSFGLRARALHALASTEPPSLSADDLVNVLRDLVKHAPPGDLADEEREHDEDMFGEAVLLALRFVAPDEAAEALLDVIDAEPDSLLLDSRWATEALAVGFPETGAVMIDHWLKCARHWDRHKALRAIERLPDELAEPRLRLAASDPNPQMRDDARQQWLKRYGQPCPVGVEGLVGASLLERTASDTFMARLAVMQGRVPEARRTLARVLLDEAPSREALVLVLQLVADDSESQEPGFHRDDIKWAVTLAERFGAGAVLALRALAERFPEPEAFGWLRRAADLVEKGVIAREHTAPLRDLATKRVLTADDTTDLDDSLRMLSLVGAPPEVLERVMALALGDETGAWEARKLLVAWPDKRIDSQLVSTMAVALAERDWAKLQNVAWVALGRGGPAARVVSQRVLELAEESEDAVDAAVVCASRMRELGMIDDAWAVAALLKPESPLFEVAARAWRGSAAVREPLFVALESTARKGSSAAVAAESLVNGSPPLSPKDRRLRSVLAGAPPSHRADLIVALCVRGAPFAVIEPYLEPLLTSADPYVTQTLSGIPAWMRSPKARALYRRILPRIVDEELRGEIQELLGEAPAPYWNES